MANCAGYQQLAELRLGHVSNNVLCQFFLPVDIEQNNSK